MHIYCRSLNRSSGDSVQAKRHYFCSNFSECPLNIQSGVAVPINVPGRNSERGFVRKWRLYH